MFVTIHPIHCAHCSHDQPPTLWLTTIGMPYLGPNFELYVSAQCSSCYWRGVGDYFTRTGKFVETQRRDVIPGDLRSLERAQAHDKEPNHEPGL